MRLVFAGTPAFAARSLAALADAGHEVSLVLTRPDRPAGRGLRERQSAVKQLAAEREFPLYQPQSLKDAASIARIAAARPEVLVVVAYGLLLPPSLLEIAPHGALNIHASLLPRWRGAAPIQRALLAGDTVTGVSIMRMDEGLDTGPVLAQRKIAIAADDDAGSLHDKLAALGAEMILAALEALRAGKAGAVPQAAEGVTRAPKIAKSEAILEWSRPALELERTVRALRPEPGARTTLDGETVKVWRAHAVAGQGLPGTVLRAASSICVACGAGALEITELQRAGGKPLDAAEFLRGRRLAAGARLGS